MDSYIRFQTPLRCGDTGRPSGIFVAAGRVLDCDASPESTRDAIRNAVGWFNQNLQVPDSEETNWRCLFWFHSGSQQVIRQLWELVYLLQDEGIFVSKVRTTDPGRIVYRDQHQVAAIPHGRSVALRRHAVGRVCEW